MWHVLVQGSPAKKPPSIFPGPSHTPSTPGSTPGSAGGSVSPSPDHRSKQQPPQNDQNSLQILNTKEIPLDQVSCKVYLSLVLSCYQLLLLDDVSIFALPSFAGN